MNQAKCGSCDWLFNFSAQVAGRKVRCPKCKTINVLPGNAQAATTPTSPTQPGSNTNQQPPSQNSGTANPNLPASVPQAPGSQQAPIQNPAGPNLPAPIQMPGQQPQYPQQQYPAPQYPQTQYPQQQYPQQQYPPLQSYPQYQPSKPQNRPMGNSKRRLQDRVRSRLLAPAISLMVIASLQLILGTLGLVLGTFLDFQQGDQQLAAEYGEDFAVQMATISSAVQILGIVLNIVVVLGCSQVMRFSSWGLGITAAILGLIPTSGCCLLSLPISIWLLITLNDQEVSRAF